MIAVLDQLRWSCVCVNRLSRRRASNSLRWHVCELRGDVEHRLTATQAVPTRSTHHLRRDAGHLCGHVEHGLAALQTTRANVSNSSTFICQCVSRHNRVVIIVAGFARVGVPHLCGPNGAWGAPWLRWLVWVTHELGRCHRCA